MNKNRREQKSKSKRIDYTKSIDRRHAEMAFDALMQELEEAAKQR